MEFFHLRHPSRVSFPLRKGIFVAQLVMVRPGSPVIQAKKTKNALSVQKKAKHIIGAIVTENKQPVLKKTVSASLSKQKRIPKAASPPVKKRAASPPVKQKAASPPVKQKAASPPVTKKKVESLTVHKGTSPSQPSSPSCKKPPGFASLGPPTLKKQDHDSGDCSPFQKPEQIKADSPPVLKKVKQTKSTTEPLKQLDLYKNSFTSLKKQSNLDKGVIKPVQKKHLHKQANGNKAALTLKRPGRAKNTPPLLQKEKDGNNMEFSSPSKLASKGKVSPAPIQKKGKGSKAVASSLKQPSLAKDSFPSFQKPLGKEKTTAVPPMKRVDMDTIGSTSLKKAFGVAKTMAASIAKHTTTPLKRHADFDDAACSLFQRQLDEAKLVSPPIRKKARRAISDSKKEMESLQDQAKGASAPVCVQGYQAKETSPRLKGQSSPFLKLPNKPKTKASSPNLQKKIDTDKLECLPFKKQPGSTVSSPPGRKLGAEAKEAIWQGIADRINALGFLPKTETRLKKRPQEVKRRKEKATTNLKSSKATRPCGNQRTTASKHGEIAPKDARCMSKAPATDGFRNPT